VDYGRAVISMRRLIDGNESENAVAYCKSKKGFLTAKQIRLHKCLKIQCTGLLKLNCKYWEERQKRKDAKKRKKNDSC